SDEDPILDFQKRLASSQKRKLIHVGSTAGSHTGAPAEWHDVVVSRPTASGRQCRQSCRSRFDRVWPIADWRLLDVGQQSGQSEKIAKWIEQLRDMAA
ncbi:MAG: hypothetical protein ACRYG4_08220, partial [Janthinobacterium lividum]